MKTLSAVCLLFLMPFSVAFAAEPEKSPLKTYRTITIKAVDGNLRLDDAAFPTRTGIEGLSPFAQLLTAAQAKVPALKDHVFKSPEEVLYVWKMSDEHDAKRRAKGEEETRIVTTTVKVYLDLTPSPQPPEVVEALGDAIVQVMQERIAAQMESVVKSQTEAVEQWKTQIEGFRQSLKRVHGQLEPLRGNLMKATGRIDLSASGVRAAKDAMEIERQKLDLDLAGLKARREALNEAIADAGKRAKESEQADPGVQATRKLVDLSETNLKRVKQLHEKQAASDFELFKAQDELELAKMRLAERVAGLGASSEAMTHWRHALIDAAIEEREKLARADAALKRLAGLMGAEEKSKVLQPLLEQERNFTAGIAESEKNLQGTARWLEIYKTSKPTITVSKEPLPADELPGPGMAPNGAGVAPGAPGL